jgi:pimeloyl-ACP methyl ester carboxylesterase
LNPAIDLHVDTWGAGERVLLVHGSFSYGPLSWAEQRPLGARWRLDVLDRRGFGASPDGAGRVDFERDAEDLAGLLAEPAHVVAHSYGAVGALLAAARAPAGVRSLTAIEPPAFGLVRGVPEVEEFIRRTDAVFAAAVEGGVGGPAETRGGGGAGTEEDFLLAFLRAWGLDPAPLPRLNAAARRSVRASMTERPPWEARLPLDGLRSAGVRVLVVRGAWDTAPPAARSLAGRAFAAVADALEDALGAEAVVFPGTGHSPQALGAVFNETVEAFWRGG